MTTIQLVRHNGRHFEKGKSPVGVIPCRKLRKPIQIAVSGRRLEAALPNSGRLTQRLECHLHTVEVTGSNPVSPIRDLQALQFAVTCFKK